MSQPKIKYQQISFQVPAAGAEVPIDADTDKLYKNVTGINVVMVDPTNIFSTLQLEINTVEIFPENFEVLRLMFRDQAPFGYDYHGLDEAGAGSKVKGKYKDVNNGASYPYSVIISLRLENR